MAKTETEVKGTRTSRFINHLQKLHSDDDRAALAELRRDAHAWPECGERALKHVVQFFPQEGEKHFGKQEEDALLLVATLFAQYPCADKLNYDMGNTMRATGRERGGDDGLKTIEPRFMKLLSADSAEEIGMHLRYAIQLAKASSSPIGWTQLLYDLRELLGENDEAITRVRRRWAGSFWSPDKSDDAAEDNAATESES